MQPAKKKTNTSIIPLLQPPGGVTKAQNAMAAGDRVRLTIYDGTTIDGTIHSLDKDAGTVLFQTDGATTRETLPFTRLVCLESIDERPFEARTGASENETRPSPFELRIGDRQTIEGMTFGARCDRSGVYLYPTIDGKRYRYRFYPGRVRKHGIRPEDRCLRILLTPPGPDAAEDTTPETTADIFEPISGMERLHAVLDHPHPSITGQRLGNILVGAGLIKPKQLEEALEIQSQSEGRAYIGQILMERGLIDEDDLNRALALELGIPFVDLASLEPDPQALSLIPEEMVRRYHLIPIGRHRHRLIVAMRNPLDWEALETIRFQTNMGIEQVVATPNEINRLINVYFTADLDEALDDDYAASVNDDDDPDKIDMAAISDNATVKLVNRIIIDAHQQGASDIHIEPTPGRRAKTLIRFRRDGVLRTYHEIPAGLRNAVVARLKIMANLDTSERRKPQDGKINFSKYGPLKIELRVATIPTAGGQEDMVLRILSSGEPIPLRQMGMSPENLEALLDLVTKPYGLFFVCGPTGSGKSTTLHSILGHINTPERKIWTAEDPIEITQQGLRQVQVNPRIGFDFATAMRAFLRADPDVIMVGEMRDAETVKTGIEASLTGHLVFSTLHTNTAVDSIARLLDMGMEPFNFSDALLGILAQRLCRRLCKHCREPHVLAETELLTLAEEYCQDLVGPGAGAEQRAAIEAMIIEDWRRRHGDDEGRVTLYEARGCPRCEETGYRGRIAIMELLRATDEIKQMIIHRSPARDLLRQALGEGMRTLLQDGMEKALMGITDMASVRAVCMR